MGLGQRMAEQIALPLLTVEGLQKLALGLGLYPFGGHHHAQAVGQVDDGAAQLPAVLVIGQRLHEGLVYLDPIDGQAFQQAQG